jgi:hypothetical protein
MTSFLLASVRATGDDVFAFGFRDPGGRVVEFEFAVRDFEVGASFPVREVVISDAFKDAVDARTRDDSWLGRVVSGFAGLSMDGWRPLTLVTVDVLRHRATLRNPEGLEVPVEVSVPYHGAETGLNTLRAEGPVELPSVLAERLADLVRYFDMQSADPLEIAV